MLLNTYLVIKWSNVTSLWLVNSVDMERYDDIKVINSWAYSWHKLVNIFQSDYFANLGGPPPEECSWKQEKSGDDRLGVC